jgi:hypothetical protein
LVTRASSDLLKRLLFGMAMVVLYRLKGTHGQKERKDLWGSTDMELAQKKERTADNQETTRRTL